MKIPETQGNDMNPTLEKTSMLVTGITLASGIGYVGLMLQLGIW